MVGETSVAVICHYYSLKCAITDVADVVHATYVCPGTGGCSGCGDGSGGRGGFMYLLIFTY